MHTATNTADNHFDHQRQRALNLIDNVGFHSAMRTCLSNGWDGVLWSVLAIHAAARGRGSTQVH
ncbi:MAG: hypothetical protein V3R98_09345 [Alphaproteobacteria bacterium]